MAGEAGSKLRARKGCKGYADRKATLTAREHAAQKRTGAKKNQKWKETQVDEEFERSALAGRLKNRVTIPPYSFFQVELESGLAQRNCMRPKNVVKGNRENRGLGTNGWGIHRTGLGQLAQRC